MNRMKFLIFLAMLLTIVSSCDPEYNYDIKGSVEAKNSLLDGAIIVYEFMPNDNQSFQKDTIFTDSKGKYAIKRKTRAFIFDSLKITISKDGYETTTEISYNEDWRRGFGLNKKDFSRSIKSIKLTKLDSTKHCAIGKSKAQEEFNSGNYIHHEFIKTGTRDLKYWDRFEKLLNSKEISLETISLFKYPYPSNNQYMHECYITETKINLQNKYGKDWLVQLKTKI